MAQVPITATGGLAPRPLSPLPPAPNCATPGFSLTAEEQALLAKLLPELVQWFQRASKKHAWSQTVAAQNPASGIPGQPTKLTFSDNRIASIIIPQNGTIYVGGDGQVSSVSGPFQGLGLQQLQPLAMGPEDGASETWAVAGTANVQVNCLEWLV